MFRSLLSSSAVLPKSDVIMAVRRSTHTLQPKPGTDVTNKSHSTGNRFTNRMPQSFYRGLRFRLTVFFLLLIAVTTFSIAIVVMQVMDRTLLNSLLQRGSAITLSAATPAGYSLLMDDRLALDNLAAQIERAQKELVTVAILNLDQTIMAHNRLDQVGKTYSFLQGTSLTDSDELKVVSGLRDGADFFEFRRPIIFADQLVGSVVIGINNIELVAAKASVHRNILLIAAAATIIAFLGAMFFTSVLTGPIEKLTEGVARLKKGIHVEDIPVRSSDELGILTYNFNHMTKVIQQQKENLQDYASELETSYTDMVRILAAALDARDNYTYGHSARVAHFALGLAGKLHFNIEELKELELACLLHDIGKIHISDAVLNKEGKLDENEFHQIDKHPVLGSQILELAPSLHKYIPTVKHHHERFDGTGYPDQLKGDNIPLEAQIVALADTYDAMTSSRPYRKGLSRSEAINEIRLCSGSQFNPKLVEPFIEIIYSFSESMPDKDKRPEVLCAS